MSVGLCVCVDACVCLREEVRVEWSGVGAAEEGAHVGRRSVYFSADVPRSGY